MTIIKWAGVALAVVLAGCGAKVAPTIEPVLNVYDNFNNTIPGVYILVPDASIKQLHREVKTASLACSSQYKLDVGTPLYHSLSRTMDNIFATLLHQEHSPAAEELTRLHAQGVIHLNLRDFQSKLEFSSSLIKEKAVATVSMTLGATVSDTQNNQWEYTGESSRVVKGEDGGSDCEIGAMTMANAIQKVSREALERLAERMANAPELRQHQK